MKKQNVLMSVLLASSMVCSAIAGIEGEGSKGGGGGDARTEGRIDEIRADILKWIGEGGAETMKFSSDLSHGEYRSTMESLLVPHAVVVTAIKSAEEKMDDEELNVRVDGQPKTCKGFFSKKDQRPHILCNVERFWEMSESDQYRQVHHEYAGLGLLEKNVGASSDYSLSTQITGSLVPMTVLRLAVKKIQPPIEGCKLLVDFDLKDEFISQLEFKGYEVTKKFTRFETENVKKGLFKKRRSVENTYYSVLDSDGKRIVVKNDSRFVPSSFDFTLMERFSSGRKPEYFTTINEIEEYYDSAVYYFQHSVSTYSQFINPKKIREDAHQNIDPERLRLEKKRVDTVHKKGNARTVFETVKIQEEIRSIDEEISRLPSNAQFYKETSGFAEEVMLTRIRNCTDVLGQ
jgi:hypothetical protein